MKQMTQLWIDALDFEEKGGWKEDTQFVHLMGGGYLLAADEPGVPVADATVRFTLPAQDHYRIWARDRNWLRPHNPGQFAVLVDGQDAGAVLGQLPSDKWLWEIAGDMELEAGEHTLALHDLTGYFGRCAAIVITNDMDFVPSREVERMHAQRSRIKGLDNRVNDGGSYDVIVAGGGPGGVPAAVACARMGVRVLLLQNRSMLGGNSSDEIGVTMDGAEAYHMYARETGIAEEIRRLRDRDPSFVGDYTRAMEELVSREENITVLYDQHVCGVQMKDAASIESVYTMNIRTLSRHKFSGRIFIDCTGDGWLGYYAGAKYRMGREAFWQHRESIADEKPDMLTMSGCLKAGNRSYYVHSEEPVGYCAPEWVPKLPVDDREFGRVINGDGSRMYWWIEASNAYDNMWDGEEARDGLLLALLGYYDHIKNHWSKKERAQHIKLKLPGAITGRRESRRLIGDYILTQNDCTENSVFEDAISYAGWHLDIHHPEGIYSGTKGPMHCAKHVPLPQIPFRCLYSVNIDNLMFAGRNISVTHLALGCTRVANTIATFGQAVGTAAAMCIRYNELPRGIGQRYIKQLQQQLIKDDQFIPGLKNEDENDPCLGAKATASSVKNDELFRALQGNDGEWMSLDGTTRMMNMCVRSTAGDVKELYVKLRSVNTAPAAITMHAYTQGTGLSTYTELGKTVTARAEVPPMWEGWVKVPINLPIPVDEIVDRCFFHLWLEPAQGIFWMGVNDLSFYDYAGEADGNGKVTKWVARSYRCSVKQPVEEIADCGAANVTNGYSRILDARTYEWVSHPAQSLPQWLQVEFEKTEIHSVSVTFDTDLTNPGTCWHAESKAEGVPACVKDYTVDVFDGTQWIRVADIKGNFQRRRSHAFVPMQAEKIRITVLATWGDPSARIMEVRAEKSR